MSPYLTVAVLNTTKTKIGACVSNPISRNIAVNASIHATLQEMSGGRMILGLGKGDSSVRRMGERPASLKDFKEKTLLMQRLANGEEIAYTPEVPAQEQWHQQGTGEVTLKFEWSTKKRIPLYLAAYGPKILRWAGEVADGVFLQIAEPSTIEWAVAHIRAGAERKGRSLRDIDIVCCTWSLVSDDLHEACDALRMFPLVKCVESKRTYDYRKHTVSSADQAAVYPDELVDSYSVLGPAQRCVEKLQQLHELGVTQLYLYLIHSTEDVAPSSGATEISPTGRAPSPPALPAHGLPPGCGACSPAWS